MIWHRLVFGSILVSILLTVAVFSVPGVRAQVMQSTNYRIQSDSINFGGGLSTSSSYTLESTMGEVATGDSDSSSYSLRAGYQQMQEVYIAISGTENITMNPSIPGIGGGISNGSTTVTVTTDSAAGYQLTIEASQSPAMQKSGDTIADYTPSGDPDYTFTTGSSDAHLGFTPEGVDIVQRFLNDGGSNCNAGSSDDPFACWDGLSTTAAVVATAASANHPNGATTTIHFRVGIGSAVVQAPGVYVATTTVTALAL